LNPIGKVQYSFKDIHHDTTMAMTMAMAMGDGNQRKSNK